jgi:hypothetical protein
LLAKDKLLRLKHMPDGFKQFLVKRLVLALEVQHGHGLSAVGWTLGRDCDVFHAPILPATDGSSTAVPSVVSHIGQYGIGT